MQALQDKTKKKVDEIKKPIIDAKEQLDKARVEWKKVEEMYEENVRNAESRIPCDELIFNFIDFLSSFDKEKHKEYIFLPYQLSHGQDVFDELSEYFDYCEEDDANNDDLIINILEYKQFFESGTKRVKVGAYGTREGYNGRETDFDKTDYVKPEGGIDSFEMVLGDHNNTDYFLEDYFYYGNENISDDIDWGDWDDIIATVSCVIDVAYIKLKKNEKND